MNEHSWSKPTNQRMHTNYNQSCRDRCCKYVWMINLPACVFLASHHNQHYLKQNHTIKSPSPQCFVSPLAQPPKKTRTERHQLVLCRPRLRRRRAQHPPQPRRRGAQRVRSSRRRGAAARGGRGQDHGQLRHGRQSHGVVLGENWIFVGFNRILRRYNRIRTGI